MEHLLVKSSALLSVGYEDSTQILQVRFKDGRVYEYEQVPPIFYMEMMTAPSIGRYFFENIAASFPYRSITLGPADGEIPDK